MLIRIFQDLAQLLSLLLDCLPVKLDFNGILISKLSRNQTIKNHWVEGDENMRRGCGYGSWEKGQEDERARAIGLEVCIYRRQKWLPKKLANNFHEISRKYPMLTYSMCGLLPMLLCPDQKPYQFCFNH